MHSENVREKQFGLGGQISSSRTSRRGAASAITAEVLIVGGGPAGSAVALSLRQAGIGPVVLVEHGNTDNFRIGESASPSVTNLLGRLGLDGDLSKRGHLRCDGTITAWGTTPSVTEDFASRGTGPGWHLDRFEFDRWLLETAANRGTEVISPASLRSVTRGADVWHVRVEVPSGGVDVRARVLIDATGRPAALAGRLGVRRRRLDALVAFSARLDMKPADFRFGAFTLVEAAEAGWWYAAEIPGQRAVVALMTDRRLSGRQSLRDPHAFLKYWRATDVISQMLPPPTSLNDVAIRVFAAGSQYLELGAGNGWLAVGDALLALDPLTSSGISGALEDALAACEVVKSWLGTQDLKDRADAGRIYARRADTTLRRYLLERHRQYNGEKRWASHPFWSRYSTLLE